MDINNIQRSQAVPLSITTRGLGLNIIHMFHEAAVHCPREQLGDIYACYRASLGLLEYKLTEIRMPNGVNHVADYYSNVFNYSHETHRFEYYNCAPGPIKDIIDSIGVIQIYDKWYFPMMAKDAEIEGVFVPRPENIVLSNLRKTVEALSIGNNTPFEYRKKFYKNNAIPGAIWDTNQFILLNSDEIIHPTYNVSEDSRKDITQLRCFVNGSIKQNYLFKIFDKIELTQKGSYSLFMSNEMCDLRVPDRQLDESLMSYYKHARVVHANIGSYTSNIKLERTDIIKGALYLLGEVPAYQKFSNLNIYGVYGLRYPAPNTYYMKFWYSKDLFRSLYYEV